MCPHMMLEPTDDIISTHPYKGTPCQNLPSSHLIYPFLHDVIHHFTRYLEDTGVAGKHHCNMDSELILITAKPGKATGTWTVGTGAPDV